MFFSQGSVLDAVSSLKQIQCTGGNRDILSYFLILSKLGMSHFDFKSKDILFTDKKRALQCLHDLGGMTDPLEKVGKRGCLFFTSFHKTGSDFNENIFYNQGTIFTNLPGRLKDTIDNTISDFLLESGPNKYYRFNSNFEEKILQSYNKKFPLNAVLVWIYRFRNFDSIDMGNIRKLFLTDYKLTEDMASKLFAVDKISVTKEDEPIDSSKVRSVLKIMDMVEVTSGRETNPFVKIISVKSKDISNAIGGNCIMDATYLLQLLSKYKQIILSGVPGTGKSFYIDEIASKYHEVFKVQFHPNYTYQDFVIGKIISGGTIKSAPGMLLNILEAIAKDVNKNNQYLLALDEINRGNLSSILGELLYALDRGKTITIKDIEGKELEINLPPNLHILGTMNSADRSIALVDYAIRRRFYFVELEPNYALIDQLSTFNSEKLLGDFLQTLNDNIVKFFKNRDYRLGHSYFIKGTGTTDWNAEDVSELIRFKMIPMLIEYAQGDYEVIKNTVSTEIANASTEELFSKMKTYCGRS